MGRPRAFGVLAVVTALGIAGCGAGARDAGTPAAPPRAPIDAEEALYGASLDAIAPTEADAPPADLRNALELRSDVVFHVMRRHSWVGASVVGISQKGERYFAFLLTTHASDSGADHAVREWRHPLDAAIARGVIAHYEALILTARAGKPSRSVYDSATYVFVLRGRDGSVVRAATDSPAEQTRASGAALASDALAEYAAAPSRRESARATLGAFVRAAASVGRAPPGAP